MAAPSPSNPNGAGRPPAATSLTQLTEQPALAKLVQTNVRLMSGLMTKWKTFDPNRKTPVSEDARGKTHPLLLTYFKLRDAVEKMDEGSKPWLDGQIQLAKYLSSIQDKIDQAQKEATTIVFRILDRMQKGAFEKAKLADSDQELLLKAQELGIMTAVETEAEGASAPIEEPVE